MFGIDTDKKNRTGIRFLTKSSLWDLWNDKFPNFLIKIKIELQKQVNRDYKNLRSVSICEIRYPNMVDHRKSRRDGLQ